MPSTKVVFYCDADGRSPVVEWLDRLQARDERACRRCWAAIGRLAAWGHELRRPHADHLREGIYELRIRMGRVNYRILYSFHDRDVALLTHGFTKEREIPPADLRRAMERRRRFEADPQRHAYQED